MTRRRPAHAQNPWYRQDTIGDRRDWYTGTPRDVIEFAYEDTLPMTCPCGGQLWYRMTVGSHQCPSCNRVRSLVTGKIGDPPGERVGVRPVRCDVCDTLALAAGGSSTCRTCVAHQAETDTCAECDGTGSIAGASHGGMVEQLQCSSCDTQAEPA